MDRLKTLFLDKDFIERNRSIFPKHDEDSTVVSHCDAQENNVLLLKENMS